MKFTHLTILALFILSVQFSGIAQMRTTIPLNEKVVSGVLPNHMHYYILKNEFPKDRVSFYFAQNVGSILEDDSQKGLAHFLEHMAFNGTEHFAGKGFLNLLQKHGVRFGADINAYTGYDETVYNISNVPTAGEWLLDSCLFVLHDWSGGLLLQDDEIDAERGVIREEWRTRRTSGLRLYEQTSQVLFKGSKYADRMPIGDINIVNNFEYKELRDYYNKWYRPDLQAVVIVGDVDPVAMEQKVKSIFSGIGLNEDRAERAYERIPDHDDTYYCLATDKEAKYVNISYQEISDNPIVKDEKELRDERISSLIFSMFNSRLDEYIQNNETDVLAAQAGFNSVTRLQRSFNLIVIPKPEKEIDAYREVYSEWERATRFGFTEPELERAKDNTLSRYKNYVANQDKVENDKWARGLYNYFLKAEPFLAPEVELAVQQEMLETISLQDVNRAVAAISTGRNKILTLTGPDAPENTYPALADFESVMTAVQTSELEAYQEEDTSTPLVTDELAPAAVKETFLVPGLVDAKGYVLQNGARVVIYPTDLAKDEILFSAVSFGGSSLVDEADLASADFAVNVVENSGLGEFKATDLSKKLSGKIVGVTPFIGDNTEGFSGSSNIRDFSSLLQLTYLYFTSPRFEETAYQKLRDQYEAYLKNAAADNQKAMRDTITRVSSNYSPRALVLNQAFVDAVSFNQIREVFTDRFQNAGDFTFVFVGNVSEEMMPEIQTYIGNIPGTSETEVVVDHKLYPSKGKTERTVLRSMDTPKTTVYLNLSGKLAKQNETKLSLYFLSQLLSKKYLDTIREDEGGSYGVGVRSSFNEIPEERYAIQISFDTDPEKYDRLMEIVYNQIDELKNGTVDLVDFDEVKSSILNMREQSVKTNKFWMNDIVDYLQTGDVIYGDDEYKALVDGITPESVVEFARQILASPDTVEVIMSPAETAAN
ncbi:M16 family metallopeptidase [Mangrovibacterium sp.]|uniref:M16 family metallopeptidase n=1 Tax=Mangrovibacterium sp. TaxID=1961364 RepID=UPI0035625A7E